MSRSVLVTDGEQRPSLAIVRSLGRAGYRVYVASSERRGMAGASRYCDGEVLTRNPLGDPGGFVADIDDEISRRRIDLVIPVTDAALTALLPERGRYPSVCFPFPSYEIYKAISDKVKVFQAAAEIGIAVPRQVVLQSPEELRTLGDDEIAGPVVMKPGRSVVGNHNGRVHVGVSYAGDRDSLQQALNVLPRSAYPVALQERILGPGTGVFILRWRGRTVASFSHMRIREKPPAGGVSVYCESVAIDRRLLRLSESLLDRFCWEGVAMVEYKIDARTREPYLMEVNGRFWGSLQLAVDAGVDFPALLLAHALGESPEPVMSYRTGVRSRWWWGDVDHMLMRVRKSDKQLALPADAPSRWKAIRSFLRLWRPGDRSQVYRLRDPGPFVRETLSWLKGL